MSDRPHMWWSRTLVHRLPVCIVALAFAVFAASALAGSFAVNGAVRFDSSITNSDPVTMAAQGTSGSCASPGTSSVVLGNAHYEVYKFRNISATESCVNVSLAVSSGNAEASLYRGSFDPANPLVNFRGKTGIISPNEASSFASTVSCYFCSPPETFDVVVWESCTSCGATYTLLIEGIGVIMTGGGPTATASLQSFRASSAPKGVVVRWKTRSEHDALGFNVYRGDVKKLRVTRSIVRASGDGRGHSYSYIDRTARKGNPPYYLEVVQRSGSKIMFGPARFAR